MNHSYRIVTHEVKKTSSGQQRFIAELTNIYLEIDGHRVDAPYPNAQFEGVTYTSAMLKANDAFKKWLGNFERCQQVAGSDARHLY